MNLTTVLAGAAAIVYGLYTAWARRAKPGQFRKIEPMKDVWGQRSGKVVHVVGYTLVPIVIGIVLILSGLRGASIF